MGFLFVLRCVRHPYWAHTRHDGLVAFAFRLLTWPSWLFCFLFFCVEFFKKTRSDIYCLQEMTKENYEEIPKLLQNYKFLNDEKFLELENNIFWRDNLFELVESGTVCHCRVQSFSPQLHSGESCYTTIEFAAEESLQGTRLWSLFVF